MSYVYAGTRAYTEAHSLLSETDFERLITAQSARDAVSVLDDTFLAPHITRSEGDVAGALEDALRTIKARLQSYTPDTQITNLFWHRYDFFNLSIIEKAKRLKDDHAEMLMRLSHLGTIDPEHLLTLIEHGKLHSISPLLHDAQQELVKTDSISLLDNIADRYYIESCSKLLAVETDTYVRFFLSHVIDQFNIQSSLRFHRGLHTVFSEAPFVRGGSIHASELQTLEGTLAVLSRFTNTVFTESHSATEIEKRLKQRMSNTLKRNAYDTFSKAPLLYFLHRLLTHIEIVRAIVRSKEAQIPENDIRNFIHHLA